MKEPSAAAVAIVSQWPGLDLKDNERHILASQIDCTIAEAVQAAVQEVQARAEAAEQRAADAENNASAWLAEAAYAAQNLRSFKQEAIEVLFEVARNFKSGTCPYDLNRQSLNQREPGIRDPDDVWLKYQYWHFINRFLSDAARQDYIEQLECTRDICDRRVALWQDAYANARVLLDKAETDPQWFSPDNPPPPRQGSLQSEDVLAVDKFGHYHLTQYIYAPSDEDEAEPGVWRGCTPVLWRYPPQAPPMLPALPEQAGDPS